MAEYKREFKNIIINKPLQARMSYYFVAISIGLMGLLLVFMNSLIAEVRVALANASGLPLSTQIAIDQQLYSMVTAAVFFLLLSTFGTIIYGLVISHRIAGPMYAILSYIKDLKAGRYDAKRPLRPYDELAPVMDALHELAEELKIKK